MQIRQVQVSNDSFQDRLVLRIATEANEEIRVFFTRRFLRELWPHLAAMLAGHLQPPLPSPLNVATATDAATPIDFAQAYSNENPTYPLGAKPLLASEATLEATGEGLARLILREGRERSFNLNLNHELLQALCAMLRAASEQSHWDLALDYQTAETARPVSPGKASSLLH